MLVNLSILGVTKKNYRLIYLLYLCGHRYIPNRVSSSQMEASYHLMHGSANNIANNKQESNTNNINSINNINNINNNNNNNNHNNHSNHHNVEHATTSSASNASDSELLADELKRRLIIETCNGIPEKTKVLNLHNKASDSSEHTYSENIKMLYSSSLVNSAKKICPRNIPATPVRILEAPDFKDNYC